MAFPEKRCRMMQVMNHLRLGHLHNIDFLLCKVFDEPARIGAIVPDYHGAVPLLGQYNSELGDELAISIQHY